MTHRVGITSGASLLALLVCLSCAATAQVKPQLTDGCPDTRLWQLSAPTTTYAARVVRTVTTDTQNRQIRMDWRRCEPTGAIAATQASARSATSEVFATPYWPTYVVVIDDYNLCVAGVARGGDVVLEHWSFGTTTAQGSSAPSIQRCLVDGTGTPQHVWVLPPRNRVNELLRDPASAAGPIRALLRDPADAEHVYVWFDGTKSLSRVQLTTGISAVCAATRAQPGVLEVSWLSAEFDTFTSGDYVGKGFCLFFGQRTASADGSVSPGLALVDSNRDGVLDAFAVLTQASWIHDGWASATVRASY
ncbi:MAG: hypothetical protein JNL28_01115 [Planctomycetes bacterium]|nr:hypothetical protein [Planctomycetota bacterium]